MQLRPFMCPYCQKTFKTCVNCKKHMKTHRQELALQLGHTADTVNVDAGAVPTANEPSVANVTDNMAYTHEVELIEVSCPSDLHLNQALQATPLGVGGQQTTVLPQYPQSSTDGLDQSNIVQQPTIIHDYRNTVVTDLQLQNVFNTQVSFLLPSGSFSVVCLSVHCPSVCQQLFCMTRYDISVLSGGI